MGKDMEAMGIHYFRGYGREDILYAGYPLHKPSYDFVKGAEGWQTTPEKLQAAYNLGREQAEQRKQANPARFYLEELMREMQESDEWYGLDFDRPIWIVEQVLKTLALQE